MKTQHNLKPRVLIIGLGRFGSAHLESWQRLEAEGEVTIAGAVVASEQRRRTLEAYCQFPIFAGFNIDLLERVDVVDIVSPSETHFELVRTCLPHVHVLVEKPLATTQRDARALARLANRSDNVLMVNHIYRFHPVLDVLESMVKSNRMAPLLIRGCLLNPVEPGVEKYCINLEFLHYFDLVDHLYQKTPGSFFVERTGNSTEVSLGYPGGMRAVLELGWKGNQKTRTLEIHYSDRKLIADFQDNTIIDLHRDRRDLVQVEGKPPLERALRRFVQAARGRRVWYPDGRVGSRIVDMALQTMPGPRKSRPQTVVVGGGIFGASCAIELAPFCDVVLIERHSDLLTEASLNNQLRHHSGFHYPRSLETMREILSTRADFDSVFQEALLRDIPAYYCASATAKEITGEQYLTVCKENRLSFSVENPPTGLLDTSRVSLCLRTDELVLNIPKLREIVRKKLATDPRIKVLLNTDAVAGHINQAGQKILRLKTGTKIWQESFHYLINATYANSNILAKWFGFPTRRLRFDLCEMPLLEVPMPRVSITILDGPFVSLMSTGDDHMFLLGHISDSVLKSSVTDDGLPPQWEPSIQSSHANMIRHAAEYLPILRQARYVESRYGTRAVMAYQEDFDGRPTVVTRHGFGCWSVLGGKIATCVSNAREIVQEIFPESLGDARGEQESRPVKQVPEPHVLTTEVWPGS